MLVGYSSSSEEESEADTANSSSSKGAENDAAAGDSFPVRKKLKTEQQLPKTRYVDVIALICVFSYWGDSKYVLFCSIICRISLNAIKEKQSKSERFRLYS